MNLNRYKYLKRLDNQPSKKREFIYVFDVSKIDPNEIWQIDGVIQLPSNSTYLITGVLHDDIRISSANSRIIFDKLKLNGGSISLECLEDSIIFEGIESIDPDKQTIFNLRTRRIDIRTNEYEGHCLMNVELTNHHTSYVETRKYSVNLSDVTRIRTRQRLLSTLNSIICKLNNESKVDIDTSPCKKLQLPIE